MMVIEMMPRQEAVKYGVNIRCKGLQKEKALDASLSEDSATESLFPRELFARRRCADRELPLNPEPSAAS